MAVIRIFALPNVLSNGGAMTTKSIPASKPCATLATNSNVKV